MRKSAWWAQTTQNRHRFEEFARAVERKYPERKFLTRSANPPTGASRRCLLWPRKWTPWSWWGEKRAGTPAGWLKFPRRRGSPRFNIETEKDLDLKTLSAYPAIGSRPGLHAHLADRPCDRTPEGRRVGERKRPAFGKGSPSHNDQLSSAGLRSRKSCLHEHSDPGSSPRDPPDSDLFPQRDFDPRPQPRTIIQDRKARKKSILAGLVVFFDPLSMRRLRTWTRKNGKGKRSESGGSRGEDPGSECSCRQDFRLLSPAERIADRYETGYPCQKLAFSSRRLDGLQAFDHMGDQPGGRGGPGRDPMAG